ncbi:unnamed protein product, partial [Prunus brigantina]
TSSFSPSNSISSLLRYPQSPLTLSCYTQSQSLSHPSHLQHLSSSPISSFRRKSLCPPPLRFEIRALRSSPSLLRTLLLRLGFVTPILRRYVLAFVF